MPLVQGTDFKCVDRAGNPLPICFGIGNSNHNALQLLQRALNRLRLVLNAGLPFTEAIETPLVVDGFVGPATLAFVQKVFRTLLSGQSPNSKEELATQAVELTARLDRLIAEQERLDSTQLAPPGQPVDPITATATTVALPKATTDEIVAATTGPTPKSSLKKFLPWILGGLAVVVVVGGVGFVYYRRKTRLQPAFGDDDDFDGGDDDSDLDGDADVDDNSDGDFSWWH